MTAYWRSLLGQLAGLQPAARRRAVAVDLIGGHPAGRHPGLPRWVEPGEMTDRMTTVPLSGPVRSMATLGRRQSASRCIGQAARPQRMLSGRERTAATAPTGTGCADRPAENTP
jgi:hypothetical protein